MPFTAGQLAEAAKVGLDFYLKNNPVDQIAVDRPLMNELNKRKTSFPGAKEYVVEQLRMRYSSNFQWYRGSGSVTYNERNTIEQAKYPWRSAHDGLMLDEDRLAQNGIIVTDDRQASASDAEMIQLTNLLTEQSEVLRLGYEEKFSQALHLDGSSSTDAIAGLDFLVPIKAAPTATGTEVVGGIDRFDVPAWLSNRETGLAAGTILGKTENMWRACSRNGGRPTTIIAGKDYIDMFRDAAANASVIQRYIQIAPTGGTKLDPAITGLAFNGVPIQWAPEWDDNFGGAVTPAVHWAKRCYMLNLRHLKLRPLQGQDMVSRKPPRPYDKYVVYMALTWKGAMTLNHSKAQGVISIT
jgi:hypothetical protein